MTLVSRNRNSPRVKIIDRFPDPKEYKYNEERWYHQHGDSMVIINCTASEIEYPEHWTPLSIKCAFGGNEYYHFPNSSVAVGPGNFLILNEGTLYRSSIHGKKPIESFTLNFTRQNIKEVFSCFISTAEKQLDDPFTHTDDMLHFVEKLYCHGEKISEHLFTVRNLVQQKTRDDLLFTEIVYDLLGSMILLNKNISAEIDAVPAKRRSTREELYKRLHHAKDFMHCFYHEDISLDTLSKICLLNPSYMLREFRKNFAITPHQYLTRIRLKEAATLLLQSDMTITDLSKAVGFEDLSSFSKLFKRNMGLSPEKFRKERRMVCWFPPLQPVIPT